MKLAYFPKYLAKNADPVLESFLMGCRKHGIQPVENSLDADAAVIWSQLWSGRMAPNHNIWMRYRDRGAPVLVLEVGQLHRNQTWRLLLNGENRMHRRGHDGARARTLGLTAQPWRHTGEAILICLQRQDSEQWHGMPDSRTWVQQVMGQLRAHTDRPIVIRCHPRQRIDFGASIQIPQRIPHTYDDFDFEHSLDSAWAVVNWNSGPAVRSVLAGVPAFVGASSLAAEVASTDLGRIEDPPRPDRTQWINDLAWTEYRTEEIKQGLAWDYIRSSMP